MNILKWLWAFLFLMGIGLVVAVKMSGGQELPPFIILLAAICILFGAIGFVVESDPSTRIG